MLWTSNLYFFIKEDWICAMTRPHVNNILLARNLPFDPDVRHWSYPWRETSHCLWVNWTIECVINLNVMCDFNFLFVFVWFRSFTSTVRLLFESLITKWLLKKIGLKFDVQGHGSGRNVDVDGQEGWRNTENSTIFMDAICVSSLITNLVNIDFNRSFKWVHK